MAGYRRPHGYINVKYLFRLVVNNADGSQLVDSGDLYDTTLNGGRLGVFVFGQPYAQWSNLIARCIDRQNEALHFDGTNDYVQLVTDSITTLFLNDR